MLRYSLPFFLLQASFAGVWFEAGDAGDAPGTAQVVADPSPTMILGALSGDFPNGPLDIDLYQIQIGSPLLFSARTLELPGVNVSDPQLFLFDSTGRGIYANDDDESGLNGSQSLLPAGHPFGPMAPGTYYLGIGWFNNEPLSLSGFIFSDVLGVTGPDFASGGADPLLGWNSNVVQRLDVPEFYAIEMTGAGMRGVPEPSTYALLLTGAAFLISGRLGLRRRS